MGKPDAPTPPNPYTTAAAQTGSNVSTAVANAYLGNVNQNTPYGSLSYSPTGNYSWSDPSTGSTYNIPTFTATQTMSPMGQAISDQIQAAQLNLATMGNTQSAKIANLLANPMDMSGAPSAGNAQNIANVQPALTSYDTAGDIQRSLGQAGDITKTYGSGADWSTDRQRVEDALMARMNPQLDRERGNLEQRLADQGIRYGSDAYSAAMSDYSRQANDARWGAISQAGQEQQRMSQQAQALAAFQNAAQQQGYEQNLGTAGFANQAQAQQYAQNAQAAQFANTGLAQQLQQQQAAFNASQAGRNQYMQEQYAARNQPINEITALLSGSQVQQPNFINTPGAQIPTTDIGGLINQNFAQQQGNYNTQQQAWNSLMGGILGLGAGALRGGMLSDRRAKDNITKMGTVLASGSGGEKELPIYEFSYKQDPSGARHLGPMAQDVEKVEPRAVSEGSDGLKRISPAMVMGSILGAK